MEHTDRRKLLLAALGGGALTVAAVEGAKAQAPRTVDRDPRPVRPLTLRQPEPTEASREISLWTDAKATLASRTDWISTFDASLEESAFDELSKIKIAETTKLTHNARLVEPLLGEIASLVDRCLAYRRESSDLEIAGVAASASKLAFDGLKEVEEKLVSIDPGRTVAEILSANYQPAIDMLNQSPEQVGKGFAIQLAAQLAANRKVGSVLEERVQLALTRFKFSQDLERQLLGRHDVPGNAHNFKERFERLRTLYETDITSAYRRAFAAAAGLDAIFEYKVAPPEPSKLNFVDELVVWTRRAMRAVTLLSEREIEFTRVVPTAVPEQPGPFNIDLTPSFAGFKSPRVRAIGASFNADGDVQAGLGLVLVKTETKTGPRVVIPIPAVKQYSNSRDPVMIDGAAVYNVDPRGSWTARLSKKGFAGGATTDQFDRAALIKKMLIHIRIQAVPDDTVESAWWTAEDRL